MSINPGNDEHKAKIKPVVVGGNQNLYNPDFPPFVKSLKHVADIFYRHGAKALVQELGHDEFVTQPYEVAKGTIKIYCQSTHAVKRWGYNHLWYIFTGGKTSNNILFTKDYKTKNEPQIPNIFSDIAGDYLYFTYFPEMMTQLGIGSDTTLNDVIPKFLYTVCQDPQTKTLYSGYFMEYSHQLVNSMEKRITDGNVGDGPKFKIEDFKVKYVAQVTDMIIVDLMTLNDDRIKDKLGNRVPPVSNMGNIVYLKGRGTIIGIDNSFAHFALSKKGINQWVMPQKLLTPQYWKDLLAIDSKQWIKLFPIFKNMREYEQNIDVLADLMRKCAWHSLRYICGGHEFLAAVERSIKVALYQIAKYEVDNNRKNEWGSKEKRELFFTKLTQIITQIQKNYESVCGEFRNYAKLHSKTALGIRQATSLKNYLANPSAYPLAQQLDEDNNYLFENYEFEPKYEKSEQSMVYNPNVRYWLQSGFDNGDVKSKHISPEFMVGLLLLFSFVCCICWIFTFGIGCAHGIGVTYIWKYFTKSKTKEKDDYLEQDLAV